MALFDSDSDTRHLLVATVRPTLVSLHAMGLRGGVSDRLQCRGCDQRRRGSGGQRELQDAATICVPGHRPVPALEGPC